MSFRQSDDDEQEFHPNSKWQEPPPTHQAGLTLYDLHRKPRTVKIDPNHRSRVALKLLHPDFRCPICMGYMQNTSLVMECMHRFCQECITTSIRLGKNECPTCRMRIPSRRSLRQDTRFDLLIQCILGDAQKQDECELQQIQLLHQAKQNQNKVRRRRSRQSTSVDIVKGRRASTGGELERTKASQEPTAPAAPIQDFEPSPLVDFLLLRHPDERTLDSLVKDSIRMSGEAPISVIQTFLSQKLSYDKAPSDVQILVRMANGGRCFLLNPFLCLGQVRHEFCSLDDTMVLYYRLK